MATAPSYIGIDVAKATLEVASSDRHLFPAANTAAGHRELIERLRGIPVALIVLESTGIYGKELVRALLQAGLPVAVVQPQRVRHFAQSLQILAKTDQLDAVVIARFGEAIKPRRQQAPAPNAEHLRAWVDRRAQVVEDRVREENRLEACTDPLVAKHLKASIKRLQAAENNLDTRIAAIIADDQVLRERNAILQNEPGVGTQTAAILLAQLPELGTVNRQEIGALAGLAPYDQSSGNWQGRRAIYGGRARVRKALYMAALTAVRCNPTLKAVYQHLVLERGKDKKLALIACARKLLVRLNAILAAASQRTQEAPAMA
jgi:transposase